MTRARLTALAGAGVVLGALAMGVMAPASASASSTVVAAFAGVVPAGAAASPGAAEVPGEVTAWFAEAAAGLIADAQHGAVVLDGVDHAIGYVGVRVGAPHRVSVWTDEYRAGTAGAAPSEPIDQWIAPLFEGEAAVGTVTAFRDAAGSVGLAYFDDAATLGAGLRDLHGHRSVVYDAPLDAYFTVGAGTIAPLSESSRAELAEPAPLDAFQHQLSARYAGESSTDPRAGMAGGGPSVPTRPSEQAGAAWAGWLPLGGGLAVVSAATLVLTARGARRADGA